MHAYMHVCKCTRMHAHTLTCTHALIHASSHPAKDPCFECVSEIMTMLRCSAASTAVRTADGNGDGAKTSPAAIVLHAAVTGSVSSSRCAMPARSVKPPLFVLDEIVLDKMDSDCKISSTPDADTAPGAHVRGIARSDALGASPRAGLRCVRGATDATVRPPL